MNKARLSENILVISDKQILFSVRKENQLEIINRNSFLTRAVRSTVHFYHRTKMLIASQFRIEVFLFLVLIETK